SFQIKVNKSAYSSRWPTIAAKTNEFNSLFPQEYTGDLYAGRHENGWVIYNPYKTGQVATNSIPFKYNTCDRVELSFSQYTAAVLKETVTNLTFYLTEPLMPRARAKNLDFFPSKSTRCLNREPNR
ncbi:MAG TPA: glycosyl hydrolase family 98 C-terminal domain-containing protein, partial [Nitrospira sp.]|nr:glycosyl hydrolase family 98 C-terminal domain-containing protein [Nitrospira sp.]